MCCPVSRWGRSAASGVARGPLLSRRGGRGARREAPPGHGDVAPPRAAVAVCILGAAGADVRGAAGGRDAGVHADEGRRARS